jgi:hypothetical protein
MGSDSIDFSLSNGYSVSLSKSVVGNGALTQIRYTRSTTACDCSGNNRSEIFCADADYQFYLEKPQLACNKHDCRIHAYVLMTNHVHLLVTPHAEDGLSTGAVNVFDYFLVTSHSKVY